MTNRKIRIRLKEILQSRGMSQAELSRNSGVREAIISRMTNNDYERISLEHLERCMAALDIRSFNDILELVWEEEDT